MPRTFALVSASIHAIVLGGVYVAQILSGGALPSLHDALAFTDPSITPVLLDVPLPRSPSAPAGAAVSPAAAPLDAPDSVTPETGRERDSVERTSGPVVGVEQGADITAPLGAIPGDSPPPPAPTLPRRPIPLHQGIQAPRKIADVQPIYPDVARTARQEGVVILETIIDVNGGVQAVHVLRGYPLLDQAAVYAVRQWRFTPALLNGQPVPVVMTVTVNFSLR